MEGSFECDMPASSLEEASTSNTGKAPRKAPRKGIKKPSAPARPYKKLSNDMLQARIAEMTKKIGFFEDKINQLKNRCRAHEQERGMRSQ